MTRSNLAATDMPATKLQYIYTYSVHLYLENPLKSEKKIPQNPSKSEKVYLFVWCSPYRFGIMVKRWHYSYIVL